MEEFPIDISFRAGRFFEKVHELEFLRRCHGGRNLTGLDAGSSLIGINEENPQEILGMQSINTLLRTPTSSPEYGCVSIIYRHQSHAAEL